MSRLIWVLAIVSLAQGQFYPGYPYRYPYIPRQQQIPYGPFPPLYPIYQPYYPTPLATTTPKVIESTPKYKPSINSLTRPYYSSTIKSILTTTAKPPPPKVEKPVFQFNNGDVIDYEYIYDTLPDERYRAGYIIPIQITTVDKKITPKKNIVRQQDVKTYTNVQTSRPNPVKETVTETSIYVYPGTTAKVNTVPTTKASVQFPVLFTTKKPPVFKPPNWEIPEESSDIDEEDGDGNYEDDLDDDDFDETTTKSREVATTKKSWWG